MFDLVCCKDASMLSPFGFASALHELTIVLANPSFWVDCEPEERERCDKERFHIPIDDAVGKLILG